MAEVAPVTYRAKYHCVGPDGQSACSIDDDGVETFGVLEGTVTEERDAKTGQPTRRFDFPKLKCPICGRADSFTLEINEREGS